jgi:hypothetical protein
MISVPMTWNEFIICPFDERLTLERVATGRLVNCGQFLVILGQRS